MATRKVSKDDREYLASIARKGRPPLQSVEASGAQAAVAAAQFTATDAVAGARAVAGAVIAGRVDELLDRSRPMLTAQGYKDQAAAILTPLGTHLEPHEVRAIVAMRLREALDVFVLRDGANWSLLLGLMCAYQSLANDRREAPAKPKGGA